MRDDEYHPHYPSKDQDYNDRLAANARKAANPFRLFFGKYTPEEEKTLENFYREKRNIY